eukprot:gene1066-3924_t
MTDADEAKAATVGEVEEPNSSAVAAATTSVGFAKRANRNRGNMRKRETAEDEGNDETTVVRQKKQVRGDPLAFSNKREGETDIMMTYESNKALQSGGNDAFRYNETETAMEHDASCSVSMTDADEAKAATVGEVEEPNSSAVAAATTSVGFAKRANRNRGNMRKRETAEDEGNDETTVVRQKKQVRGDPLAFSNKREGETDIMMTYESNKALQSGGNDAFRYNETETAMEHDARTSDLKTQLGFRREHTIGSEKGGGSHGPLRANMYARVTTRFDYQPDICKDYKQTGFCSYGDSCKFMHDRGDYKSGWEIERDWEEEQKQKVEDKKKGLNPDDDEEEEEKPGRPEDDLPFACYICREEWAKCKNPVMTRCRHYFCQSCALKHHAKGGKCAICDQSTQGIFNVAQDIVKKMKAAQAAQP